MQPTADLLRAPVRTAASLRPRKLTALVDLENGMCRFPYRWRAQEVRSDDLTYGYCGAAVACDRCSWCARHLRLVFAAQDDENR